MSEENDSSTTVQLGFPVAIEDDEQLLLVGHRNADYNHWDGGQLGGRPSWLVPDQIPKPLKCTHCETPLLFLGQIYAPLEGEAFHRSLYVFVCNTCETPSSVRVLRAQLHQVNPYYPNQVSEVEEVNWQQHQPSAHGARCCAVCGHASTLRCPLQERYFCSPAHQREYKRHVFGREEVEAHEIARVEALPSVYRVSELVVEAEPEAEDEADDVDTSNPLFETGDEDDSDGDLEQDDLNAAVGAAPASAVSQDATAEAFFTRVRREPDQCLRYQRWQSATPLWISSSTQPSDIPACRCGAERRFEFQFMPQVLHYLAKPLLTSDPPAASTSTPEYEQFKQALREAESWIEQAPSEHIPPALVEAKKAAVERMRARLMQQTLKLDFGVVAVYTCTASCVIEANDELGAYAEEFAWRQPSLDACL